MSHGGSAVHRSGPRRRASGPTRSVSRIRSESHDTPGPGPGGGGVIAKNGTDAVKIIMIKIRDVPAKTGLLATLNDMRQNAFAVV